MVSVVRRCESASLLVQRGAYEPIPPNPDECNRHHPGLENTGMSHRSSLMCKLLATALAVASVGGGIARADGPLEDHRWRSRILLLYVPAAGAPALATFRERVRVRECGVADRDLVIGEVIGDDAGSLDGQVLPTGRARSLRADHGIATGRVATVLVGKDGGVKLEADGVADLDRVFRRIDGMPVRRQEMAGRGREPCQ